MNKFKIISFLILTSFSSFSFAGAAERQESIYDAAMKSRNGIGVSNVRAANDMINADITQRVTVDGSNATINTKVSIPANDDSFKRNTAKHAKNLLKGGAVAVGAAIAMDQILDGVGWVIDEGGKVTKKPDTSEDPSLSPSIYYYTQGQSATTSYSLENASTKLIELLNKSYPQYTHSISSIPSTGAIVQRCNSKECWNVNYSDSLKKQPNPNYNPSAPPPQNIPVSDGEMEDAFYNWFKNNTHSLTDPVTTYIYSPKDSQGNALPKSPQGKDPSFGPNEITDEMMENYMEHRDANLQNPYTTSIQDSTQTDTTQNPDGSKTTTTTNPDGSKTTTRTDTKTDPDTGEVTTTVTETTTMPDGSTSTKTETSTQTKPKPETTELPAFCEYAATLCTWINKDIEHKADQKSLWEKITDWFDWTKENEELPDDNEIPEIKELEIDDLDTGTFKATAGCPADIQVPVSFGGASKSIAISYEPICALAQKWSFIAPLIGFISGAMILIGVGRKGEDGDS